MTGSTTGKHSLSSFRPGYPRFAKLLSTDTSFQNFRRFTRLRSRLLLQKQDELCKLEQELDEIDRKEPHELFLGCMRMDSNVARRDKVAEINIALKDFDEFVSRGRQIQMLPKASERDVENLQNWVCGTRSLARTEVEYLNEHDDLMNLVGSTDTIINEVEHMIEDIAFWFSTTFASRKQNHSNNHTLPTHTKNQDGPQIHVLVSKRIVRIISRLLTTLFATVVVIAPMIALDHIKPMGWRIGLIFVAALIFLSCISIFTKARAVELFAAGASYTAVLVVFTAAGDNLSSDN